MAVALALIIGVTACSRSSTTPSGRSPTTRETPDLNRFLLRSTEMPGLSPVGKPEKLSGVRAFVADIKGTKADERRLSEHGFRAFLVQRLEGPADSAGVTNVNLFSSEDGAMKELEYLVGDIDREFSGARIERFNVPEVSTATGFTADLPDGRKVANVYWSQGRCVMTIGSEPPMVDPLRAGVKAIYDRTKGQCP